MLGRLEASGGCVSARHERVERSIPGCLCSVMSSLEFDKSIPGARLCVVSLRYLVFQPTWFITLFRRPRLTLVSRSRDIHGPGNDQTEMTD